VYSRRRIQMGLGKIIGTETARELLKLSPQIIEAAQQVFTTVKKNRQQGSETDAALQGRLAKLEEADVSQAELLERMAAQLQGLSTALDAASARIRRLTLLAAGSFALSVLIVIALFSVR
jgi:hypothetical protein